MKSNYKKLMTESTFIQVPRGESININTTTINDYL